MYSYVVSYEYIMYVVSYRYIIYVQCANRCSIWRWNLWWCWAVVCFRLQATCSPTIYWRSTLEKDSHPCLPPPKMSPVALWFSRIHSGRSPWYSIHSHASSMPNPPSFLLPIFQFFTPFVDFLPHPHTKIHCHSNDLLIIPIHFTISFGCKFTRTWRTRICRNVLEF